MRSAVRELASSLDARIASSSAVLWFTVTIPLLALYIATLRTDPQSMSIDPISVTTSSWQVAHHGTPRVPIGGAHYQVWLVPSGSGHVISNREPGLIALGAVFYWLLPFTTIFDVTPASLAAAVVTSAAMGTLALVFRRLVPARTALIGALIAGTATTTWAVSGTALWPHGPDQLYLSLAMLALAAARGIWAGFAFALAIITRPHLGVVAAVTGTWRAVKERSVQPLLAIGAVSACGLAAYLTYSYMFWDGGLQSQFRSAEPRHDFVGTFFNISPSAWGDFAKNIAGTLVSPGRGILFGAPFLVVIAFGLRSAWRASPTWVRSSAVGGLCYLLVQLKANRFGGGSAFWSYRYPLESLTLMAPLLMLAWSTYASKTPRRRGACIALVIFSVALQAAGALCFRRGRTNWWGTNDLAAVAQDHPWVAGPILVVGYLAATITYRRISDPLGERSQSVLVRFRRPR